MHQRTTTPSAAAQLRYPAAAGEDSFAFAFDNPAFADRVLCVRLLPDSDASCAHSRLPFCPSGKSAKACAALTDSELADVEEGKEATENEHGGAAVLRLHVNSMLLAGRSRFFLSLFSTGLLETNQNEVWLSIHEEEKEALLDILGFLYTGAFKNLDFDHLLKVLLISDKYDVPSTLEAASWAIRKQDLTPHQCEVLLDLQSSLQENKAFNPAVARGRDILEAEYSNLDDWWSRPEVWHLGHHVVRLILCSEIAQVTSENTAFAVLEKWLSVDWEGRHKHIPELAPLLRWPLMDINFLQDVVRKCEWLTHFDWFQELFTEAVIWQAFSQERKDFVLANTDKLRYRHRPEPPRPARALTIEWEVDVGQLPKGTTQIDSLTYQYKGYYFSLQLCKEQATSRDGSSVGLYVYTKSGPLSPPSPAVGSTAASCYLPVSTHITVRNPATLAARSVKSTDNYSALDTAWGWKDFLRPISWTDFLAKRSDFVSPHGSITFVASIRV